MEESETTFEIRQQHIKQATEVNRKHAEMLKLKSDERKQRSRLQAKAEIIDNKNIDYKKYMPWVNFCGVYGVNNWDN